MLWVRTGLLAALLTPVAPCAFAPRRTLPRRSASQDVMVTATVTPIAAEWSGRTVISLSAADLARLGIRSLADAARLAPGVDVRARGPLDVQTDFSIRGATFGQSLVLVDGLRLNDSQSGHHNGDIPAMLAGIERIEVATGPGRPCTARTRWAAPSTSSRAAMRTSAATFATGEHGYVDGQFSAQGGRLPSWLNITAWGARSCGFEEGREFAQGGASAMTRAAAGRLACGTSARRSARRISTGPRLPRSGRIRRSPRRGGGAQPVRGPASSRCSREITATISAGT